MNNMDKKEKLLSECLVIEAINPMLDPKFSPNLYKFMRAQQRRGEVLAQITRVFCEDTGTLWIGYRDDDFLIGAKLVSVLCNGAKTTTWAFASMGGLTELKDFWPRYTRDGRCAIDTEHRMHFLNDESRWATVGDRRSCRWCGNAEQVLHHSLHVIKRDHWVSIASAKDAT